MVLTKHDNWTWGLGLGLLGVGIGIVGMIVGEFPIFLSGIVIAGIGLTIDTLMRIKW